MILIRRRNRADGGKSAERVQGIVQRDMKDSSSFSLIIRFYSPVVLHNYCWWVGYKVFALLPANFSDVSLIPHGWSKAKFQFSAFRLA